MKFNNPKPPAAGTRRAGRLSTTALASVLFAFLLSTQLAAQEPSKEALSDVDRAIRDGTPETLEAKFRGGRTPDEIHSIAQAWVNKARKAKTSSDRDRALDEAEKRFKAWIEALQKAPLADLPAKTDAALAGARVEYAAMLMGLRAAGELDQFDITQGQQGDREKLLKILAAARDQYARAGQLVATLNEDLAAHENEFLAAGIYDKIIQLKLDTAFNDGWASYYIGVVEPKDDRKRTDALRTAEHRFQELIDTGQMGAMQPQCYLGLAMAQREQRHYPEAERSFAEAMKTGGDPVVEAQARCELARCHFATGKFAEGRTVLAPLVEKADAAPKDLPTEQRAARFYINLACLLDANSYLLESDAVRAQATDSTARTAILRKAERTKEAGLNKLSRLAGKGGPWPAVVQLYITANIQRGAPLRELTPTELLFTAKQLSDSKQYKDALERLQEALKRPEFQKDLTQRSAEENDVRGQLLMELGKCYYRLDDLRQAAATFDRLAREQRGHELASQAATFAHQLWADVARKSKQKADYAHLADALLNLIQSYPDHPDRAEATWLLPVALQAAGRYADAADEFAKVPESSKHRDEAQFRQLICRRLALEDQRGTLAADEYVVQASKVAAALTVYAEATQKKAAGLTKTEAKDLLAWSADARINAAELLAGAGVERFEPALQAVADFEQQYPDNELIGRVLGLRIRAMRGLRQFDKATELVMQYLQTASPERAGAVLSSLARGMQDEVERLQQAGQAEAARKLAAQSIETFVQLEQWLRKDEKRAAQADAVALGRAEMLYAAGDAGPAKEIVAGLLKNNPQNGNYQRLAALIATAQLPEAATAEQLNSAQAAWAELLKDTTLRKRAPEYYWEARYNWLALVLREGKAKDVAQAVTQELVWYPDLGGPEWHDKLLDLRKQARAKLGLPDEPPSTDSAPASSRAAP